MKLTAQEVPWSSVVGNGIMLMDKYGACVAILNISIPSPAHPRKSTSEDVAKLVTTAINNYSKGEK